MELALFGISALLSTVSAGTVATLYVWPWLRTAKPNQALAMLVAPHLFLRFLGLSLLVPGVVAAALPRAFAVPAAYGDLVAGVLAIVATVGRWQDKPSGPGPPSGRSTPGGRLT